MSILSLTNGDVWEDAEPTIYTTSVVFLTPSGTSWRTATEALHLTRLGNLVQARINSVLTTTAAATNTYMKLCTIPVGFRPPAASMNIGHRFLCGVHQGAGKKGDARFSIMGDDYECYLDTNYAGEASITLAANWITDNDPPSS